MLVHGLQGFQGASIWVPRPAALKPNPTYLAERFQTFEQAG
jgi:hypothetical protein